MLAGSLTRLNHAIRVNPVSKPLYLLPFLSVLLKSKKPFQNRSAVSNRFKPYYRYTYPNTLLYIYNFSHFFSQRCIIHPCPTPSRTKSLRAKNRFKTVLLYQSVSNRTTDTPVSSPRFLSLLMYTFQSLSVAYYRSTPCNTLVIVFPPRPPVCKNSDLLDLRFLLSQIEFW